MIVTCEQCGRRFDDEHRWTICPHNPLEAGHDSGYCRRHDLFTPCACCEAMIDSALEKGAQPSEPAPGTGTITKRSL